jgi:oligoendopeptidase F
MSSRLFSARIICSILIISTGSIFAGPKSMVRDSIPGQYKWDLSHIYPDWETWELNLAKCDSLFGKFEQFEGRVVQNPETLIEAFHLRDDINRLLDSVYTYASLSSVTDQKNNELQAKRKRARSLWSDWEVASSWFHPELLDITWDRMASWLKTMPELNEYQFEMESLYRQQAHILGKEKEQLLSLFSDFNSSPSGIYDALTETDMEYPTIVTSDGDEIYLTYGNYTNLLSTNRNQADRAMAFDSSMIAYKARANTHASIYDAVLKHDWAMARARGYESTLESHLDSDNIPTVVFENLISAVKQGSESIRRYFRFKKDYMGLDNYHMYDRFIPIIDYDGKYTYDDVQKWIIASVEPLGPEYQDKVAEGFRNRWIDVYENDGKSTGGFCSGVYGVHPYILVNFNETAGEMFTIAHEMGHAMHSVLANENQPYSGTDYSIFVAEVASISNELLLLDYLMKNSTDPKEKIFLLQHTLDGMRGTFYRQLLFADFEWRAHQEVEQGKPVTSQSLYNLNMSVIDDFYGDDIVKDSLLGYYWSGIPHFHFGPYYVYKYATSYAAASHIVGKIINSKGAEKQEAVDKYLNLLRGGGSDYPMVLLEQAGVDMSDPQTYQGVIDLTGDLVTKLENELSKL